MESATRIDWAVERLRRDETVATQFLDWHLRTVRPPRRSVVQAAESYRQWCADTRSGLLHVDVANPVDAEAFDQQWRMSAETSEIRAPAGWAEVGLVSLLTAPLMTVIAALAGSYVVAAAAVVISAAAYFAVRTAEPSLLVGPTGRNPPFWITGAPWR